MECLSISLTKALNYSADFPALVVKASGLAAGKGVVVATNKTEACQAVRECLQVRNLPKVLKTQVAFDKNNLKSVKWFHMLVLYM